MTSTMMHTFYARRGKRVFDFVVGVIALLLLSPMLLVVALLVRLSSKGPAIYRQKRVGRDGKVFRIAKFRSMFEAADKTGPAITSTGDPRITPVGRVLRLGKLDELPQLWNVVLGDMSLVGPRPEVPAYVDFYSDSQRRVLTVRPGITDPASIAYRWEEKLLGARPDPERYYRDVVLPEKLAMNLDYIDRISLSYDLSLLLRTTGILFSPKWSAGTR